MKSVLISIRPKWVEKIASGQKTIEVRKTAPKEVPFKCYIYCTKAKPYLYREANPPFELFLDSQLYKGDGYDDRLFSSKVIGEFICDKIDDFYCASVPYQRENNLGYGRFIDNGVYKVNGWHEGIVFERNDRYIDTMLNNNDLKEMCLSAQELFDYIGVGKHLYAWHISDLKIYDKPKELSEFSRPCSYSGLCFSCKRTSFKKDGNLLCNTKITRPPQSWMRVEDLGEEK